MGSSKLIYLIPNSCTVSIILIFSLILCVSFRDKLPVSSYLNHVWSSYINAVKHEKQKVPAYIYNAHHSIMDGLPWNLFVPELAAFDQMIQVSSLAKLVLFVIKKFSASFQNFLLAFPCPKRCLL